MSVRDEGATHYFGDDCPGGHRAACVAGVDWDDQETAVEANAREAAESEQPASPTAGTPDVVTDEMVDAYDDGEALGMVSNRKLSGWALRAAAIREGLAAVVPLIRAQVVAEQPGYEPFVAAGPDEREVINMGFLSLPAELQAAAERAISPAVPGTFAAPVTYREDSSEPDEPVADVVAAFEAGEKGETKRPLSNREFIAAEVERLGLQPKVDAWWAEIENAPPPPAGWCLWHQTHVAECPGDTDECREARTEIGGGDDRG